MPESGWEIEWLVYTIRVKWVILEYLEQGPTKSPGGGHGNSLQYSCLENPMDRRAWSATVHRVTNNQTQLKWPGMHAGQIQPDVYFCKVLLKYSQACTFTYHLWLISYYSYRHMQWLWQMPLSWQSLKYLRASLMAQMVGNLPAMQQTRV